MAAKPSLLRRLATASAVFTISLLVGFLFVEVVIRMIMPQPFTEATPGLFVPDPPRRYRLAPGHQGRVTNIGGFDTRVSINSNGLRGPEVPDKKPGTVRILVLGDSYTFGWGVEYEESYTALLAKALEDPRVETLNAGVPGFGTQDQVDWLRAYGPDLDPDLVVLGIFAGNDLIDAVDARRNEKISFEVPTAGPARGAWLWIYRHSHLIRLLDFMGARKLLGMDEAWLIEYLRDVIRCYSDEPTPLVEESHRNSRKALAELAELADQQHYRLAALLAPAQWQFDSETWKSTLTFLRMDPDAYDPQAPIRFYAQTLGELGVPALDLAPSFGEAHRRGEGPFYFSFDAHWNMAGHLFTARELGAFLSEQGLLTETPSAPEGFSDDTGDETPRG